MKSSNWFKVEMHNLEQACIGGQIVMACAMVCEVMYTHAGDKPARFAESVQAGYPGLSLKSLQNASAAASALLTHHAAQLGDVAQTAVEALPKDTPEEAAMPQAIRAMAAYLQDKAGRSKYTCSLDDLTAMVQGKDSSRTKAQKAKKADAEAKKAKATADEGDKAQRDAAMRARIAGPALGENASGTVPAEVGTPATEPARTARPANDATLVTLVTFKRTETGLDADIQAGVTIEEFESMIEALNSSLSALMADNRKAA